MRGYFIYYFYLYLSRAFNGGRRDEGRGGGGQAGGGKCHGDLGEADLRFGASPLKSLCHSDE